MSMGSIATLGFGGGGGIVTLGFGVSTFPVGYPKVVEIPRGRRATVAADFSRRYSRIWQVKLGDKPRAGGPGVAILATGLAIGQVYDCPELGEFDAGACITQIECTEGEHEDGCEWFVTAQYGPWVPVGLTPLLNPAEIQINGCRYEKIADYDWLNDRAVLNSAGDPFDPPVMVDDTRTVITITRNEAVYDLSLADSVRDTINDGPWLGFPARTVKALAPVTERLFHPDCGFYWRTRYEFELNRDTWDAEPLDAGFRRKSGSGQLALLDKNGGTVQSPACLNGAGQPLGPGEDPVFLSFGVYKAISFAIFNLEGI